MRDKTFTTTIAEGIFILLFFTCTAFAQPGASELADEVLRLNSERLKNIDVLVITTEAEEGGFIPGSVTRYSKTERDGYAFLEPVQDESEAGSGMLDGLFDDQMSSVIREADSVTEEQLSGYSVYKVVINDKEKLNELMSDDFEFEEEQADIKQVTLWLDKEELISRKIYIEQENSEGAEVNMEVLMENFQNYSGLPIAHTVHFFLEGLDEQFSEEDKEEARRAMEEMEDQLKGMPEVQRKMIEERLKPQMEQFRMMLDGEEVGKMSFRVVDVQVNP